MPPIDPLNFGAVAKLGEKGEGILNRFRQRRRERNDDYDLMLSALFAATRETQVYVARKTQDVANEAILAKLWHTAAVAMRRFDVDLADRLYLKGYYWTEPSSWTDHDVHRNKIGLNEMHEICRQLILEKP